MLSAPFGGIIYVYVSITYNVKVMYSFCKAKINLGSFYRLKTVVHSTSIRA